MFLDQTVPHMLFRSQGREVLTLAESFYFSPTEGLHQNRGKNKYRTET